MVQLKAYRVIQHRRTAGNGTPIMRDMKKDRNSRNTKGSKEQCPKGRLPHEYRRGQAIFVSTRSFEGHFGYDPWLTEASRLSEDPTL